MNKPSDRLNDILIIVGILLAFMAGIKIYVLDPNPHIMGDFLARFQRATEVAALEPGGTASALPPTWTAGPTITQLATATPYQYLTPGPTFTGIALDTTPGTPSLTLTVTGTATDTDTPTPTFDPRSTRTPTPTLTPTGTLTPTPTSTRTPTPTRTDTPTDTPTDSPTPEPTNTPTAEPTNTPTPEPTNTPQETPTP